MFTDWKELKHRKSLAAETFLVGVSNTRDVDVTQILKKCDDKYHGPVTKRKY